ncbi:MAG TPA: hypothetical protein VHG93_08525 [Longimicrobium sp.]|nr:hypothetical protein [Longimicrobium sp.]
MLVEPFVITSGRSMPPAWKYPTFPPAALAYVPLALFSSHCSWSPAHTNVVVLGVHAHAS